MQAAPVLNMMLNLVDKNVRAMREALGSFHDMCFTNIRTNFELKLCILSKSRKNIKIAQYKEN